MGYEDYSRHWDKYSEKSLFNTVNSTPFILYDCN